MMDLDFSSTGDYTQEVFAIRDRGAALSNHDDNLAKMGDPVALAMGNKNQPLLMTTTPFPNPNEINDLVFPDH